LFYRDRPELYGLHPDGIEDLDAEVTGSGPEADWTLAEAVHTAAFWIVLMALTVMTMILAGLVFHQASLYAVRGLERSLAVAAFQMMALGSVAGNLGVGALLDRVKPRLLMVASLLLLAAAMTLVQFMATPVAGLVYAGLLGLVSGSYRVMDSTIWAKYFGRRHLGAIRGATMIGTVGGTALGAYPLGLSYDTTGSYATALLPMLVLPLGIAVAAAFAKRPHKPVTGGA
jgi:predicted MFS family arabinose efflux permease